MAERPGDRSPGPDGVTLDQFPETFRPQWPENRADLPACFEQDSVRRGVEADVKVVAALNEEIKSLDRYLIQNELRDSQAGSPAASGSTTTSPGTPAKSLTLRVSNSRPNTSAVAATRASPSDIFRD